MSGQSIATIDMARPARHEATARQLRGSSLLLAGRGISMVVNFAVQILIVNYLTKADYGAFAYALSLVVLGQTLVTFGLDRAVSRFVPLYHEQRDYPRLFGTIMLAIGTVIGLGFAVVLFVYGGQSLLGRALIDDQRAIALLLILVTLAPVQALDALLVGLFAVFARPRAIFFRKHMLGPGLKLGVVLLLILRGGDVFYLAGGYLAAGAMGMVICGVFLVRLLRDQGLTKHFTLRGLAIPARQIFPFTIPLLSTDLVYVLMSAIDAVLLGHFGNANDIASLRAVQPTALWNQAVFASFGMLFTPAAARLFARKDREGINTLYWQTAIWIAVISFPIFALTCSLARPATALLYGERYADSAVILALLAFGYYFNAALGFNGTTLAVFGKVRYSLAINLLAVTVNLGVNLLLIPRYGALGAAFGTATTLIAHNLFKQVGLRLGTGISLFERMYLRVYLIIIAGALGLFLIQFALAPPSYVGFALAALVSLLVAWLNRRVLNLGQTFPELLRLPGGRYLFGP